MKEELLVLISIPLYTILIGGEILLTHWKKNDAYTVKDTLTNVYLMLLNMGLDVLLRGLVLFVLIYFYDVSSSLHLFRDEGTVGILILYWFGLFIAEDFAFYWLHRIDHSCRVFWAVHVTHHSSEHFNLTTGFRSSVFQPVYRVFYFIPLAVMGFAPMDIYLMYSATQIYGIIIHTREVDKLGWLEYILVTPSHHRVHHASNIRYLDKNLGMVLIIWDKLFGTFVPETEPVRYGLHKNLVKKDPVNIVFHEWKSIWKDIKRPIGWKNRLLYLFNPPGWSHDGSTQTAKALREQQQAEEKKQKVERLEQKEISIEVD
ncbi:MAG: sterol desaturase family protein [Saprospiraceae bacterium]|nr:sterol desaturase family protein [Saprospiraceae bacterium]